MRWENDWEIGKISGEDEVVSYFKGLEAEFAILPNQSVNNQSVNDNKGIIKDPIRNGTSRYPYLPVFLLLLYVSLFFPIKICFQLVFYTSNV